MKVRALRTVAAATCLLAFASPGIASAQAISLPQLSANPTFQEAWDAIQSLILIVTRVVEAQNAPALTEQPAACSTSYHCKGRDFYSSCPNALVPDVACELSAGGTWTESPQSLSLSLSLSPTLLKSDDTTKVSWSARHVSSCDVTGTNNDGTAGSATGLWRCAGDACAETTTKTSSKLTGQTTYTLSCTALDGTAASTEQTVRIVPGFIEE